MSAINDMKQAVQILSENVRHEAGILYAGVRDNDKTRKAIVALIGGVEEATAELEALRQERDGLLADAVRYRWLRSNNVGPSQIEKVSDDCNPPYFTLKCEGELDAAIDKAMAKEQGDGA